MSILKVAIQPNTEHEIIFRVGDTVKPDNIRLSKVTDIRQEEDPATGEGYIAIFLDGKRYADYYRVPFALFYQ